MATRLEQIKQALIAADRAGNVEDARRLAEAFRQEEARQALAVNEANPPVLTPPAPVPTPVGGVEAGLREGAASLEGSRGFLEQLAATPYNLYELGAATIEGREPVYAQPQIAAQQRAQAWRDTGDRPRGLSAEIGAGIGGAAAMLPEMLATGGAGTTRGLTEAGRQTLRQYIASQADEAARASAIIAPRMGAQTSMEAEQAGATLPEALAAGAVETAVTPITNILPVSSAGRLGTRLATGAVGGVAAEAGVQGAVNPLLPEELAAQRDIADPTNLTTAAGLGALMGAAFGTRPAPRVSDAARDLAAMRDAEVARGIESAQELPAVSEAERAIADLMSSLPEGGLDLETRRGEASTLLDTTPVIEEPAGPSSPFLPRSERVNLEQRRGEASTLLDVPEKAVAQPEGPVSVLPGVAPQDALALDTPRGEATPLEGPESTRARFEAQRVDAEEQIAFLTSEKQALLENPTRESRVRVREIDRQLGNQAIRRAVAVKALEQPTTQTQALLPEPELPLTRQARASSLEEARSLSQPIQEPAATTPAPRTQTLPSVAPTRSERVAARTVAEQVVDPVTGQAETVVEAAISPDDAKRRELEQFFSQPRAEPISGNELNNAQQADIQAVQANPQANVVPAEARAPSVFEKKLAGVSNARGAMKVIRSMVIPDSPFVKILDALDKSPFLNDVPVVVVQPGDRMPRAMESPTVRGILQPYVGGKNAVFLRGSGFRLNGTQTPEIALHEIVHAASVDLIDGVDKGRIKDPKAIVAVKQIDTIRQELAKALQDRETREGLTGPEKVNLDYATKNSKEFVSQALSSSAMQSGLKKENLWSRFVNGIRNLFRGPRSTAPLWDKIADASLSVVETQTELEGAVRASRAQAELEPGARRADSLELEDADAADIRDTAPEDARRQVLGQDRTITSRLASKTSPFSKTGIAARKLDYALSRIFFSERGSNRTVEEVMGYKQGVVERINAEAAPFVNRLRALLKSVPARSREQASREIDSILKGDLKIEDAKFVRPEFGPSINQVRDTIDKFTVEIGQEVKKAYAGRDMPKSTLNLLGTLKANLGSYVSRTYLSDSDNTFASDLWGRYKKGEEQAVAVVQPLVNRLSMEIASLPETLRQAREEAQALSDSRVEILPEDTFLGSELRRLYENYIGSSVGRTKEDMLQSLTRFSDQAKDVKSEAERVTQEIMGVGKATSSLSQYYRGLRSNDQPLRKRSAVPKEIRDVWGEITDPLLNAINTTQRMGALLSGLRASNMLAEQAPDVFTDRFNADTGQTFEVPNNPLAYGQLAGKYTDEGTFNLVVGQNEMVSSLLYGKPLDAGKFGAGAGRLAAEFVAKATSYQKMASIVLNPFVAASNVFNVAYMPLVNGNTDATLLPEAVRVASKMLGSARRIDEADPILLEVLEQGIIDPVLTQADNVIRQRTKEARTLRKEGVVLDRLGDSKKMALDTFDTLKEGISFLETLPKIWNYLSHKKTFREMFPDLSDTEVKRLAAEETNRLNLTYARVPDVVRMTETAGISYVAGYMQQILATSVYSLSSGTRQAIEGIRSGNKKLAMFGIKKIGGSVAGYALASYIPMFVAEAMGWIDLSEDDEDKQALLDTLAFTERGMQPVIMGVNPEGVLTHADLGRLSPYDSTHSVLRALASASGAVAKGESEKAEANLKSAIENLGGQFFGGSPIGSLILRGVQGKAPPSAMEADAKKLHDSIVLMGQTIGLSETATSNLLNVAWTFNPAALRGIARGGQLEQTNPEAFSDNLVAGATFMRAPVRTHDPFNNLARVAQFEYKPAVNRDDLRKVLLLEGGVSRERIQDTVSRLVDSEAEAFNDLVNGVRAARYAGRLAGMPETQVVNRIRESLEAGGIAKSKARAFVQETIPYEPTLIGNDWGKEAIQTYLRGLPSREYRTKRERELNERLRLIQDVVKEAQPRRQVSTNN